MKHLTKGMLESRKKKRERNRPVRLAWKRYFRHVIKTYNEGGRYDNLPYPPLQGG